MEESDSQVVNVRLQKLQNLKDKGIEPYPHNYDKTHSTEEAISEFTSNEDNSTSDQPSSNVSLAGRIVRIRRMGRATFMDIQDKHGRIQGLIRLNTIPDSYESIKDLDIGDWIGISGPLFRTKTGEITIEVQKWTLLAKSLRPLPEKWHGLTDTEIRYRQRYLDLISSEESLLIATLRSKTITSLRTFMNNKGFMEVETPILVPIAAGANAHPFVTHHNSLDRDLYLRIATELYLKRLIVGGLEKIYEVGKVFRNEGIDFSHNPEFTMMESYEAFADYNNVMSLVEEMVYALALEVLGSPVIHRDGHAIDLTPPWTKLNLQEEIKKNSGIDILKYADIESLQNMMISLKLDVGKQNSWGGLVDKLLSSTVEPSLIQPTFLLDYPVEMSPLAKKKSDNPNLVERFEGFIAGMEICNAFSELNDPIDQRKRLEQQEDLRRQFRNEELDRLDDDYLIALEHGMPPTGGLGIGIDRLVMLFTEQHSIREAILFPQLRTR